MSEENYPNIPACVDCKYFYKMPDHFDPFLALALNAKDRCFAPVNGFNPVHKCWNRADAADNRKADGACGPSGNGFSAKQPKTESKSWWRFWT